ncbi:MFS transporter [uncultured Clostridium sp.]|uniref:MFS transporter n=1 Tax=uncultured Clostridium sp. TaxID=59620 RepID=UPI0026389340|nr:MFS transporter [uncultured Clostridium sp.]
MKRILFVICIMAASANLPAPLFPIYQLHFYLNNFDLTLLFAIYTACMIPSLLISTSLVKRNGTKSVVCTGIVLAILSSLIFIFTKDAFMLYLARAVEGIALGNFMGTSNGLLIKNSPNMAKALALSGAMTLFGFGLGPFLSGLIAEYSPLIPYVLPYIVLFLLLLIATVLLLSVPNEKEPVNKKEKIRFSLGIPTNSKTLFLLFICPTVFIMLALNGVVISLIPIFVHTVLKSSNLSYSGILLLIFLGGGFTAQFIRVPRNNIRRIQIGMLLLIIGTWLVIQSGNKVSMMLLFLGMIILAIGNGLTFQSSIQLAGMLSTPEESSSVISTYYLAGYTGMAVPTIGIGILSVVLSLMWSLVIFGILITILGVVLIFLPRFINKKHPIKILL